MEYKETENEYVFAMLRKNSNIYNTAKFKHMDPGVVLVFPKNYDFICKLPKLHIKTLIKHGWTTEKTIFLEIPYVVTFTPDMEPSFAQVWQIRIPNKKSIFRAVIFMKNYVSDSHIIELEDTIIHEQIHIQEDEPKLLKGYSSLRDYGKNEIHVESQVEEKLLKKYGKKVHTIHSKQNIIAFNIQHKSKTISSGFMEYWIQQFFNEKFDEYDDFAIPMNNKW